MKDKKFINWTCIAILVVMFLEGVLIVSGLILLAMRIFRG